jgi:hypothetical protein
VIPAGVQAPYQRGQGDTRQIRSQAERDDEALALAERTGVLLAAISGTLADDQLHAATRARLEWFASEIRDAGKAGHAARVGELADRLAGERVRRQHWWNADGQNPAALPAGDDDDEIYDAEMCDDDDQPAAIEAAAPAPNYAAELAIRGYLTDPAPPPRQCSIGQVYAGSMLLPEPNWCRLRAEYAWGPHPVCWGHHEALSIPMTDGNGPR